MELRELYQEIIIDHNRSPRNHHALPEATCHATGHNPLCGDRLVVYLQVVEDRIQNISFMGRGCAISQASASLMTEALKGKTLADARQLFKQFHHMVLGEPYEVVVPLEKLKVLEGVCAFPARVKCASLAWHTVDAALQSNQHMVTTE